MAKLESSKIKIKYRTFNEKWKIAQIEALQCKDLYPYTILRNMKNETNPQQSNSQKKIGN